MAEADYARNGASMPLPPASRRKIAEKQMESQIMTPVEQATLGEKRRENEASDRRKQAAIDDSNYLIGLVDDLVGAEDGTKPPHPGFKSAVGLSSYNPMNKLYGSGKDFNIRLDQIKGKQFETLKGGGQITQIEGEKATNAIARMNTAATEEEFVKAAREFQSVVRKGLERLQGGNDIIQQGEQIPAKTRRYNPKTGRIE
jgi:hypothetical protein